MKATTDSGTMTLECQAEAENRLVLAAALAAALVEYGRWAPQAQEQRTTRARAGNWRTLARWEQLRGQG